MAEAKRADSSLVYEAVMSYAYVSLWILLSATGESHALHLHLHSPALHG